MSLQSGWFPVNAGGIAVTELKMMSSKLTPSTSELVVGTEENFSVLGRE